MQEFKAPILSANKKGKAVFVLVVTAGMLILIFTGIYLWLLSLIGTLIFVYSALRYYLQTRKQVLKKVTGEIRINEEYIKVADDLFKISDIKAIMISVSGWQHYKATGEKGAPLEDFHTGDNNILSFLYNGEEKKYEIQLASKEQWSLLREYVISWYKRGIKVVENDHSTRTYGLQSLNYSQIQEFKKLIQNPSAE